MKPIAHIRSAFPSKFGIPRQSNIVADLPALIVFEPEYRVAEALRGIEDFDYLWLIWQFSKNVREEWSPTVRPPRLGGNTRMGVFATRSSFRPNALGLSSVRLLGVDYDTADGPVIRVAGADLMDGTPIFDIKPYLPYTDAHPEARSGFAPTPSNHLLQVRCEPDMLAVMPEHLRQPLLEVLSHDPRPSYQNDPERQYGFTFAGYEVRFLVKEDVLTIVEVEAVDK